MSSDRGFIRWSSEAVYRDADGNVVARYVDGKRVPVGDEDDEGPEAEGEPVG
jgi:hypothetical protein